MKRIFALLALIVILFLPGTAQADFSITFKNTTEEKMNYLLYWIDHPHSFSGPFNIAGGEINSRKERDISYEYKSGEYYVVWHVWVDGTTKRFGLIPFTVGGEVTHVIITPDGVYSESEA